MKNLIKTAASATLVALIAAVPMASVAATTSASSVFTEVPRDLVGGPLKASNIVTEGTAHSVDYATSPNIGKVQPANVILGGDKNRAADQVGAR